MKALGVATYLALLVGTSASHAQTDDPVKFDLQATEPTTLEECMEALWLGEVVPGLTNTFGEGGSFLVAYGGYVFDFLMKPETVSSCTKLTPTVVPR